MFTTILRIAKLLRPDEKLRLLLLALLRSSVSVIDLLAISILAIAVSVGTGGGIPSALSSLSPGLSSLGITTLIIASACLFLSKTLFGLILARVSSRYLAHLESLHSNRIARRIFSGDLRFFRDFSRQEIEWGVLRSTENLLSGFVGQFLQFLSEFALAIAIISLFFATDSSAAFFVLGYLGLFAVLFHSFTSKRIRRAGETFANHSLKFMNILSDMISAFREIVVLSVGEEYLARLHGARRDVAFARASEQFLSAIPRLVIETGLILGALFFAAIELGRSTGSPDYGSVTVFLAGSLRMMSAVLPLQRSISAMIFLKGPSETALGFIERSERLIPPMEFQPVDVDNRKSIDELRQPVGVRFSKVSFNYSVGHPPVLTDISLEIKPGTLVGLVGPSGAGKSTLADLLIGIQKPQVGTVRLNGIESSEFRASFPGLLGYVPQKPGIVSGSIMSNVALGVPENKIDLERVRTALEKADILSVVMSLRGQFQADIGKHHDSLSGGQLQRLGIARALYSSPSLLVLDEATSALDAETEASISHTLLKLRKSCTVVVIAHRLSTIQNADNIFMLESGRLSGEGNFLELRTKNARFREFIRLSEVGRNENEITA